MIQFYWPNHWRNRNYNEFFSIIEIGYEIDTDDGEGLFTLIILGIGIVIGYK